MSVADHFALLNASMARMNAQARVGTVVSLDPAALSARVSYQPESILSGWLPLASTIVGLGHGIICLPKVGGQVLVVPLEGDYRQGIIIATVPEAQYANEVRSAEDVIIMHRSGARLTLSSDGSVRVQGDLHVAGDVHATGNVAARTP